MNPDGTYRAWLGDLGDHDGGLLTLHNGIVTGFGEMAGSGTYRIEGDRVIIDIVPEGLETVDRYVVEPSIEADPEKPEALSGVWTAVNPDDGAVDLVVCFIREPLAS